MRTAIIGVALTVAVVLYGPAGASAKKALVLRDPAGTIAPGTVLTAESSNLDFSTSSGTVECEHNDFPATLATNGAGHDNATETEAQSLGEYMGIPDACKLSEGGGPVDVAWSGFSWALQYKSNGMETVKGSKHLVVTFTILDLPRPNECIYEAGKLVYTMTEGSAGSPLPVVLTPSAQTMRNPGAPGLCPKAAWLKGTWSVSDANGTVSSEVTN